MRKQFAAPAIHFKGSGWAKKDRGGSSSTKAAAKAAASEARQGRARRAGESSSVLGRRRRSGRRRVVRVGSVERVLVGIVRVLVVVRILASSDTPKPSTTD